MDRRVTLAKRYEDAITERFRQANQEPVKFKTTIGRAAAIDRAAHRGQTLLQAEPSHKVSDQYRKLAREVEQRVLAHRATLTKAGQRPALTPLPAAAQGVTANA